MVPESIFCTAVLMMNLLALPTQSNAQDVPGLAEASAFRTDRLSARQIRLWHAIRRVAAARDPHGHPLHPTLDGLWQTVEQSGHLVFMELITDKEHCSNQAAETVVEKLDPTGRMHSIKVRLFIPTIDRAYAGEQAPQEGMAFVPFTGLRHESRYAKVLGHELAHIERMLRDPNYMNLVQEINTEQLAIAARVGRDGERLSITALQERSDRIWPLVLESEKPALAAEREIYRELLPRKKSEAAGEGASRGFPQRLGEDHRKSWMRIRLLPDASSRCFRILTEDSLNGAPEGRRMDGGVEIKVRLDCLKIA